MGKLVILCDECQSSHLITFKKIIGKYWCFSRWIILKTSIFHFKTVWILYHTYYNKFKRKLDIKIWSKRLLCFKAYSISAIYRLKSMPRFARVNQKLITKFLIPFSQFQTWSDTLLISRLFSSYIIKCTNKRTCTKRSTFKSLGIQRNLVGEMQTFHCVTNWPESSQTRILQLSSFPWELSNFCYRTNPDKSPKRN